MKDRQGIVRGKCMAPQCECSEYMAPQDSRGARCEYCDHVPVKHVKIIELGACMKCKECDQYETEEVGSYSDCGYCECPAQYHQGAEKLSKPAPTVTSIWPSNSSRAGPGAGPGVPNIPRPPNTSWVPVSGPPNVPNQCKVPGCTKPCFVEKGRVHDFCGRKHAEQYKKLTMQHSPYPASTVMYKLPSDSSGTPGVGTAANKVLITGPVQTPSSQEKPKVCENCRVYPPNKGYKLCQRCYTSKA